MTDKEKIKIYELFLHNLQLNAQVVLNKKAVGKLIENACSWSYAHRSGNGQLTEEEQQARVDSCARKLNNTE